MKQIDEEKLQTLWNQYYSIQELADEFQCSTAVIRRVLRKLDIPCDRSTMMYRHFQKHQDELWVDIKRMLDDGLSIHAVSKMYHVAMKTVQKLIEEHQYKYQFNRKQDNIHSSEYKQLLQTLIQNHTVKDVAMMLQSSETTIERHLKSFGLTSPTNRVDIKDEDVLIDWKNGLSIMDIAKKYHTSHDTISKRLKKHGIVCTRKDGINRHFQATYESNWENIRMDLDACVPISEVACKYNMKYENVYWLMEQHCYKYFGFEDLNQNDIQMEIDHCLDKNKSYYLQQILLYYQTYHNRPVVCSLARYCNLSAKDMQIIVNRYKLAKYLGTNGLSTKVLKVLHDLDNLQIRYELNNRSILRNSNGNFMELDIYLPDYKLGIEINPTWTHSVDTMPYGQPDKCYHQKKALLAEQHGVGLIQLYDTDFIDNRRYQVFLIQLQAMTVPKIKIGARQCMVVTIDRRISNTFLNQYHFQGAEHASQILYGMYFGEMLVGVFTIGQSRYTGDSYEIIRYCMHPNYIVYGCFEKFLCKFTQSLQEKSYSLVSYMDLNKRLRATNVYEKHGFMFDHITTPDYVWINRSGTCYKTRYATTKSQLVKQGFDSNLSESEIMRSQNFCRIYGAGSKCYIYRKE